MRGPVAVKEPKRAQHCFRDLQQLHLGESVVAQLPLNIHLLQCLVVALRGNNKPIFTQGVDFDISC
jgi:hypothetical protein